MRDKEIERLIIKYLSFIKTTCKKYAREENKAELLKSEVLEKIWRYRNKFIGKDEEFKFWTFRIIYNTHINNYKRSQILKFDEAEEREDNDYFTHYFFTTNHYNYENIDYINNIYSLLENNLNPDFISTFKLSIESGLNSDELSRILKTPRGTIRRRVFEIRKFIKQNLHRL